MYVNSQRRTPVVWESAIAAYILLISTLIAHLDVDRAAVEIPGHRNLAISSGERIGRWVAGIAKHRIDAKCQVDYKLRNGKALTVVPASYQAAEASDFAVLCSNEHHKIRACGRVISYHIRHGNRYFSSASNSFRVCSARFR